MELDGDLRALSPFHERVAASHDHKPLGGVDNDKTGGRTLPLVSLCDAQPYHGLGALFFYPHCTKAFGCQLVEVVPADR